MKYTKQDANQYGIENYLIQTGFCVLRLSDFRANKIGCKEMNMHPLDLLVLGLHRKLNIPVLSQWEIKTSKNAPTTEGEQEWLQQARFLFGDNVPINIAYSVSRRHFAILWVDLATEYVMSIDKITQNRRS